MIFSKLGSQWYFQQSQGQIKKRSEVKKKIISKVLMKKNQGYNSLKKYSTIFELFFSLQFMTSTTGHWSL